MFADSRTGERVHDPCFDCRGFIFATLYVTNSFYNFVDLLQIKVLINLHEKIMPPKTENKVINILTKRNKMVYIKVQPGSIVLFHNAALHTPEALPTIIQTLFQEGYTFVSISQIILAGEYTIDHTGRQYPA